MIIQTTGALADLTLNSPVTAQGTGFAAVLSTQRNLLNNGGASELQTPNGHWALYANNPSSSVFGGLTAPINLFEHSIGTLPPASLPSGANAIVFQSLTPPAPTPTPPPVAELPTATFVSAGLQWRELNSAESSYSELLDDVRGFDFLDLWKRFGYVPLEVMNGGMKLAHGLAIQEVEMQKMRRRLGISGDREPRYFWWR